MKIVIIEDHRHAKTILQIHNTDKANVKEKDNKFYAIFDDDPMMNLMSMLISMIHENEDREPPSFRITPTIGPIRRVCAHTYIFIIYNLFHFQRVLL